MKSLAVFASFLPALLGADHLTPREFDALRAKCAPGAPSTTLRAIARVESAFYPLAVSVNYPERAAIELGLGDGTIRLSRQPRNFPEALAWIRWLKSHGQTVSVGLMQVNTEHLPGLRLTLEQLFDPCTNIRTGWLILSAKLDHARRAFGNTPAALHAALSSYNAGNWTAGLANGYVQRVSQSSTTGEK